MPEDGISADRNMQHTCEGNLNSLRESNLIIVQQDATVFSLLYFYMCRVSTSETCRAAYRNVII